VKTTLLGQFDGNSIRASGNEGAGNTSRTCTLALTRSP